jgi:MFS family permease
VSGEEAARGGLSAQRELWANASWRRWVLAASVTRLCATMMPFALLLAGEAALGSFSAGAWMTSVYSAGAALAAPFRGRVMDRRRLPEALHAPLLALAALCIATAAACALRAPLPVLLGLSLLLGVIPAGVGGAYRSLMTSFLAPKELAPAFAIDAVLIELTWISGPPLVGAIALAHPSLSLGFITVCAGVATLANRYLPPREAPPASTAPRDRLDLGPLLRGLPLFVFIAAVFTGVSWGTVDTALPARLVQLGSRAELWGALAALLSATSAVGGLIYAGVARPASAREALGRSLLFLSLWSGLLLPLGFSQELVSTAVWLALAGFFLAPLAGLITYLLQQALPADRQAEGFSLYGACWSLGIGGGSALTAVLLEHASARAALVLSGAVPLALVLGATLLLRPLMRAATGTLPPLKSREAGEPGTDAEAGTP